MTSPDTTNAPRAGPAVVNHVGIAVGDVIGAIDFYEKALGFRLIMGPRLMVPPADAARSPLGPTFKRARQAHLVSANGVGFELFQFIDPPMFEPVQGIEYRRPGTWHVCVTDPDVEAVAKRIVAAGGKTFCEPVEFVPGKPYRLVYCSDPWGTIIEVMSHPYAEVFSNWPQPGMTASVVYIDRETRQELAAQSPGQTNGHK